MDCAACGNKVDTAIRRLPGVEDVAVSVSTGAVKVRHADGFDVAAVTRQVRNLGYGVENAGGAGMATAGKPTLTMPATRTMTPPRRAGRGGE